jgi:hypothetical protein
VPTPHRLPLGEGRQVAEESDPSCHFDADPDPNFHFDVDPDPDRSVQIKAQNLGKVLKGTWQRGRFSGVFA